MTYTLKISAACFAFLCAAQMAQADPLDILGLPALAEIAAQDPALSVRTNDAGEIDTMIMLRRMALLAWIGSHIEAPKPQKLAPSFAENTAQLGQSWLDGLSVEI